jgi:hypothetical protein
MIKQHKLSNDVSNRISLLEPLVAGDERIILLLLAEDTKII